MPQLTKELVGLHPAVRGYYFEEFPQRNAIICLRRKRRTIFCRGGAVILLHICHYAYFVGATLDAYKNIHHKFRPRMNEWPYCYLPKYGGCFLWALFFHSSCWFFNRGQCYCKKYNKEQIFLMGTIHFKVDEQCDWQGMKPMSVRLVASYASRSQRTTSYAKNSKQWRTQVTTHPLLRLCHTVLDPASLLIPHQKLHPSPSWTLVLAPTIHLLPYRSILPLVNLPLHPPIENSEIFRLQVSLLPVRWVHLPRSLSHSTRPPPPKVLLRKWLLISPSYATAETRWSTLSETSSRTPPSTWTQGYDLKWQSFFGWIVPQLRESWTFALRFCAPQTKGIRNYNLCSAHGKWPSK